MAASVAAVRSGAGLRSRSALTVPTNIYSNFVPRQSFDVPESLPKTYFLGHHASGLRKMKELVSSTSIIIECRDYRIPLTARNPYLEQALGVTNTDAAAPGGPKRLIVFTKRDLGVGTVTRRGQQRGQTARPSSSTLREVGLHETLLRKLHMPDTTTFLNPEACNKARNRVSEPIKQFRELIKSICRESFSLTGHKILVVGLPNAGKSTLLNALRNAIPAEPTDTTSEVRRMKKAARTGSEPGVTRSVSSPVALIRGWELEEDQAAPSETTEIDSSPRTRPLPSAKYETVYVHDTPGVFAPYVSSPLSMLKLALCGVIKDSLVAPITVADYLLYRVNLVDPRAYASYSDPTNNIDELLGKIAKKTGRVVRGAGFDLEAAAMWWIQRWRDGKVKNLVLDAVTEDVVEEMRQSKNDNERGIDTGVGPMSMHRARKIWKEQKRRQRASANAT